MRGTKQTGTKKPSKTGLFLCNGGEIGIRTLGTGEGTTDFESVRLDKQLRKNKHKIPHFQWFMTLSFKPT